MPLTSSGVEPAGVFQQLDSMPRAAQRPRRDHGIDDCAQLRVIEGRRLAAAMPAWPSWLCCAEVRDQSVDPHIRSQRLAPMTASQCIEPAALGE